MRISAEESDVAYRVDWQRYVGTRVWCDGVELRNVCTADDVLGYVKCAALNADGEIYADGDHVATEELHGVVRIELPLAG